MKRQELSNRTSTEHRVVAAAAGLALAFGLSGCFETGHSQLEDATTAAIHRMHTVAPDQLLDCEITGVKAGPPENYQSARNPSVSVAYSLHETPLVRHDPWLRDRGSEVEGQHVEVVWEQEFAVSHTMADKRVLPGVTESDEWPAYGNKQQVIIPLNSKYQGDRQTKLGIQLTMFVDGVDRLRPRTVIVPCGQMELDVEHRTVAVQGYSPE